MGRVPGRRSRSSRATRCSRASRRRLRRRSDGLVRLALPPPRRPDPGRRGPAVDGATRGRRDGDGHRRLRPGHVAGGDRRRRRAHRRRVGHRRPASARRRPRRRHDRRPARRAAAWSRSASAGSTTTTTTRPRRPARRRSPPRSQLAHERGLPLVIHTREAWDDTFDILDAEGAPERTMFHCFTGGPDEARRCLELGALSASRASSRSRRPPRSRRRRRSCRSTGCWSRPTARTWRRSRTAAGPTSRRGCRSWGAASPTCAASPVDELAARPSANAERRSACPAALAWTSATRRRSGLSPNVGGTDDRPWTTTTHSAAESRWRWRSP